MLALLSVAELAGMSVWFTGSAVAPELGAAWDLTVLETGWLTTAVQLGFVAGTAVAAILNLADLVPGRWYFPVSAFLAAVANAALLVVPGLTLGLAARFATGFFLAGVYPPAMKMTATWFRRGRGLAIGTLIGALTIGSAIPYLLRAFGGPGLHAVLVGSSLGAGLGGALVLLMYRDGPYPFPRRPFAWALVARVARHRQTRLATAGYLGHMWELYGVWTWLPAFLLASADQLRQQGLAAPTAQTVQIVAGLAIALGAVGCVWGGGVADRIGRERFANLAMTVSGCCCIASGFLFGSAFWAVAALAWLWGIFVVADSAQFSALITEVAPPEAVGTALTLQTSVGFLLTMVTIQGVPAVAEAWGWEWAFVALALGPAAGIRAMLRLASLRKGAST
jgi:MFS family permease